MTAPTDLVRALPCPVCGYDLRGHPDDTICPECGQQVAPGQAILEERRWLDRCLVDLWSIAVLETIGALCAIISLVAIALGQYLAVVLGMMAVVYLGAGTVWFVISIILVAVHVRRHVYASVDPRRKAQLRRWILIDMLLVLAPTVLFLMRRP